MCNGLWTRQEAVPQREIVNGHNRPSYRYPRKPRQRLLSSQKSCDRYDAVHEGGKTELNDVLTNGPTGSATP